MRRIGLVAATLLAVALASAAPATAAVVLEPATGGTNIPLDTWATLSGPKMIESAGGDIGTGTIRFDIPSWFVFDTQSTVTARVTDSGRCRGKASPLRLGTGKGSTSQSVQPSQHSVSITVVRASAGDCRGTIEWSGLRVKATSYESGNIYRAGSSSIAGVPFGTVVATLSTVQPTPSPSPTPVPIPSNDDWATAQALGLPSSVSGDSSTATVEADEPTACGNFEMTNTVWYRITPNIDGVLVGSTDGSDFTTLISLYEGGSLGGLTQIGCGFGDVANRLRESVHAGATYFVQVGGWLDRGRFSLSLSVDPPLTNDDFADGTPLELPATASGNNQAATVESGEPTANCVSGLYPAQESVWYRVTPQVAGTLVAETAGSSFDTVLALYTGSAADQLSLVACNDNMTSTAGPARLITSVGANQTYHLQLAGARGEGGDFQLAVRVETPPANDDFDSATPLGTSETVQGTTIGATVEDGEPLDTWCSDNEGRTVWYRVVPDATGRLTVATAETEAWSLRAILFVGSSLATLTDVACGGGGAGVAADVVAGQVYHLRISGSGLTAGSFTLQTSFELPPANDDIAAARSIVPPETVSGSTRAATTAPDEPVPGCRRYADDAYEPVTKTVWYRIVPEVSGTLIATTRDLNFSSVLALYARSADGVMTELRCNDRYGSGSGGYTAARISHPVEAGSAYYLQLGAYQRDHGVYTLDVVVLDPPQNDDWADSASLSVAGSMSGDTTGATTEDFEGPPSCEVGKSVWFRIAPTASGRLTATATSEASGEFLPKLGLYPTDAGGAPTVGYFDCMSGRGVPSQVTVGGDVVAGAVYYLQLGGEYETAGPYRLETSFEAASP